MGFSQKELARAATPVDLSWQVAVMGIVVQNKLVLHMDRFKVEAQSHHTSGSPAAAWRDEFPTLWMEAVVPAVNIITAIQGSKGFSHFQDWILNRS